jgi:hypothetical protein
MNRRRRFFATYLTTAIIGFVAVFFGAPLVRGSISSERLDRMARACLSDAPLSGVFIAIVRTPFVPAPQLKSTSSPGLQPPDRQPQPVRGTDVPRADAFRDQSKSVPEQTPVNDNVVPATPVCDYKSMWAIVTNDTAGVYDSSGNLAQELEAGSLVEVGAVRTNQSERLAVCRYDAKPNDMGIALIRTRDLALRRGNLESVNADLVSLLVKQARLETEIRALRAAVSADLATRNPNTEAYSRARSACLAFNENAKSLRAKADGISGSARVEIMDKLRSMKDEEAQLRREYETAKRAFDKWNEVHTDDVKDAEPVKALQRELADVRKQVGRFDAN